MTDARPPASLRDDNVGEHVLTPDPSRKVAAVRVYYEDGPRQLTPDADWAELPADGVQIVIVQFADGTKRLIGGYDWFFRARGPADWIFGASNPEPDPTRYRDLVRLRGRWTDDATYAALEADALAWEAER